MTIANKSGQIEVPKVKDAGNGGLIILAILIIVAGFKIHSEWQNYKLAQVSPVERFAVTYPERVIHASGAKPHDCDYDTAPLGKKWCHYDRILMFDKTRPTDYVVEYWQKVQE